MIVYQGYNQEQLDLQYNNRHHVPDFESHLTKWDRLSRLAEAEHLVIKDISYGDLLLEKLDVFPAPMPGSKTLIFIHGGYWHLFDKSSYYFIAAAFAKYGITTVLLNYPLAPAVSIDEIVAACRKALRWVHRHITQWNGDPSQLYVVGHSSGGHLAAQLITGNSADYPVYPQGICAISGLFNLVPIQLSKLNACLGMNPEIASRNSPTNFMPNPRCSVSLAVGASETAEFKAQSVDLFNYWSKLSDKITLDFLPDLNHFSILDSLADRESQLHQAVCRMMGIGDPKYHLA